MSTQLKEHYSANGYALQVGDVVNICTLPLFGRFATVQGINAKGVCALYVHLTGRIARIHSSHLNRI